MSENTADVNTEGEGSSATLPTRKGPPTHEEVRADERSKVEAEMDERMAAFEKRMEQRVAAAAQDQSAQLATVAATAAQGNAIPSLKRTKLNISDDIVRGVAHATGGASHEDVLDPETGEMVPWTPPCPDWVYANYGGTYGGEEYVNDPEKYGRPTTHDGEIAEYLFKQAYLNDIRMTQEMLPDAMEAYKERGETPRLTAPQEDNAAELASMAQM